MAAYFAELDDPCYCPRNVSYCNSNYRSGSIRFLGLGAEAPQPEWGKMLADARIFLLNAPWAMVFPGLAIMLTVIGFNLMGDGLRDALDPKMKN